MVTDMKIVATTILHEKEGDWTVGELSYLSWHYKNMLIDYEYLDERKESVEEWLHDACISSSKYKSVYKVTLNVKYWQIGTAIFTVENHETRQIKKTITKEGMKLDKGVIPARGFIVSVKE